MSQTPPYSPLSVRWCHACEAGGTHAVCPDCGAPMVAQHPGGIGTFQEGGMHASR